MLRKNKRKVTALMVVFMMFMTCEERWSGFFRQAGAVYKW